MSASASAEEVIGSLAKKNDRLLVESRDYSSFIEELADETLRDLLEDTEIGGTVHRFHHLGNKRRIPLFVAGRGNRYQVFKIRYAVKEKEPLLVLNRITTTGTEQKALIIAYNRLLK